MLIEKLQFLHMKNFQPIKAELSAYSKPIPINQTNANRWAENPVEDNESRKSKHNPCSDKEKSAAEPAVGAGPFNEDAGRDGGH